MSDNIGHVIQFELDGEALERRLVVQPVEDPATELNTSSPVGQALLSATPGQSIEVATPGGALTLEVLSIGHQGGGQ